MDFLTYNHGTVTYLFFALRVITICGETGADADSNFPIIVNRYISGRALSLNVLCLPIDRR